MPEAAMEAKPKENHMMKRVVLSIKELAMASRERKKPYCKKTGEGIPLSPNSIEKDA